ncbi:MAG: UDP-N-acetylmuramoyl-L-alanyl-D-glutamate--2,6-diaminopimelate ligase [Methylococcales bacterium]|nr:UDP-N-acetylmuramoyl-L-alanyl-D-glutamate--2,6-diaminopimelate ligase [Methylococcales bacterium]
MKLDELLIGFTTRSIDIEILGLALNSQQVSSGYAFMALNGEHSHGLDYADPVIKQGARVIIYDPKGGGKALAMKLTPFPLIEIENLESKLADIAARFYCYPAQKLAVIGVTGTNGKTSCSQFLAQVLPDSIVVGTLGWGVWGKLQKTQNTTPDALSLHAILAHCVNEKKKLLTLEVSSHGLELGRVKHVKFKGAIFTNLTQDHLDFHPSMEAYFQAKCSLFKRPELEFAIVNLDDAYGLRIIDALSEHVVLWTFSCRGKTLNQGNSLVAEKIQFVTTGLCFEVRYKNESVTVSSDFYGEFNVENILAMMATLLALGESLTEAAKKATSLKAISGRMERFSNTKSPQVFVDYAHTPDALLKSLTALKQHHHQQISLVFGCGGNRDKGKRMQMGKVASQQAHRIIITDDNPRYENNQAIICDILTDCDRDKVTIITDRKAAITRAIRQASSDDCILIAGKGHEDYQTIEGTHYSFSDQEIVEQVLQEWVAP